MSSLKQIEANRRNAQKSTGPRTPEGKMVSRMNALKSGIHAESECIFREDVDGLEALAAEYIARFDPATPEERFYVDTLIRNDWLRRRFARIDAEILEYEIDTAFDPSKSAPDGQAYSASDTTMARLQRRIELTERSYKNALHELERLRQARPTAVPEPHPVANGITSPQIGFVPQVGQDPALPGSAPEGSSPEFPPPPLRANPQYGAPSPNPRTHSQKLGVSAVNPFPVIESRVASKRPV